MFLVEVIPIARAIIKEKLTYFSLESPPIGSMVTVPLRNKKIKGIVSDIRDARNEKTSIKNADFELKKIDSFSPKEIVPRAFSETAQELAYFYITTLGSVLWSVIPKVIIQNHASLPTLEYIPPTSRVAKINIVVGSLDDRLSSYRAAIRQCFAQKTSLYMCVPTIEDAEYLAQELSRGIETHTFVLHSELSKKKTLDTWNAIHTSLHPVFVVGTPSFICIPRQDIGTIIIEREGSRAYRMQSRPYIDMRRLVEVYAKRLGAHIIKGDTVVSTENWSASREHESGIEFYEERPTQIPHLTMVDMSAIKLEEHKPFSAISDALHALIKRSVRDKKRIFLFTPRKGLYPTTICGDCGTVVLCDRCSAPVVVHHGAHEDEFIFICHHCGKERATEERCVQCGSWKLAALGVGIERVFEDIAKAYPDTRVTLLDKHSEPTRGKARKKIETFKANPGGILVGTEYALLYLSEVDNSAVVSLDSLFLIPDFRMNERILGILSTIQSKTKDEFLVQARNPGHPIFSNLTKKTMRDFYTAEVEERRNLGYPPFSFFIKLSRSGKIENVDHDIAALEGKLKKYDVTSYPGRIEKVRNAHIKHILIKLQPDEWVDEDLWSILKSLPPYWSIKVDPDSLL